MRGNAPGCARLRRDQRVPAASSASTSSVCSPRVGRRQLQRRDRESRLGHRLRSTHIEASAVRAGKARAKLLGITADDPVLHIRFTPHDVLDRPLAYAEMFFRGDALSYEAVVKR